MAAAERADSVLSDDRMQLARDILRDRVRSAAPVRLRIRLDDRELPGSLLLVEAMSIRFASPGLLLAPEAEPDDGLLEVVAAEADERQALLDWLSAAPDQLGPELRRRRAARISITWDGAPLHVDDEFHRQDGPAEIEIALEPQPVQVVVPAA